MAVELAVRTETFSQVNGRARRRATDIGLARPADVGWWRGVRADDLPVISLTSGAPRPGIASTAYDTAWLASIPSERTTGLPRFPTALRWLVEHQHADGSWGSDIPYYHDRIISTLAALVPLARFGRRKTDREAITAGQRYLWDRSHFLRREPTELVGSELLLPALVQRARRSGIAVPPNLEVYGAQRDEKLRLIPPEALYSPNTTAAHSLEFLGDDVDILRLERAQGQNGGVGNSPAATAFFFSKTGDGRALAYLERCMSGDGGASVPVLAPCETFELIWSAYHLYLAGIPSQRLFSAGEQARLLSALDNGGVSLSTSFPVNDADDTAVATTMLRRLGGPTDASALRAFAQPDGHFASFPYERHPSIGVNVHALQAVIHSPDCPDREAVIDRLVDYVVDQQVDGMYWLDKWHVSPYYATAHTLCCLRDLDARRIKAALPAIERAREWLRRTQNRNGSWGFYGQPTVEETAYAVLALAAGGVTPVDRADWVHCCLGVQYLRSRCSFDELPPTFPSLWIDKCLYFPPLIVRSAIEAAFIAFARISR
jgi:halimadienyl-diphosphate synthase